MRFTPHLALAAVLCLGGGASKAATQLGDNFSLSGFGTLGAVTTNTDEAQYRTDIFQNRGADEKPDLGVDSRLGLQLDAKLSDSYRAVAQVLVRRRLPADAAVEWLYGEAKLPADLTLKVGRVVMPTFMLSDSRSVGYSAYWLRPPQEVYGLNGSTLDGAQLMHRAEVGPVKLTTQLSFGRSKTDFDLAGFRGTFDARNVVSLNMVGESGDWLVRIGYSQTDLHGFGPTVLDRFPGVGVQYDDGTLVAMAEYVARRQSRGAADCDGWYVSAGWRVRSWTPYASFSEFTPKGPAFGDMRSNTTSALGVRWDLASSAALKAQYQVSKGGALPFINASPDFLARHPLSDAGRVIRERRPSRS